MMQQEGRTNSSLPCLERVVLVLLTLAACLGCCAGQVSVAQPTLPWTQHEAAMVSEAMAWLLMHLMAQKWIHRLSCRHLTVTRSSNFFP